MVELQRQVLERVLKEDWWQDLILPYIFAAAAVLSPYQPSGSKWV
jgi:hypothetical protein